MTEGFTGTGVALVTPFREDNGIDFAALEKVVDHVINGGVEYLVVLGTTGETATLPEKEKVEVIHAIKEMNNGRVPVVLGIGGNNTAEVVESVTKTDLSGIDAILSVAPYYNKPTQEGLFGHFKAIADASPLPLILYNVPSRTASNLSAATVLRLAEYSSKIIGIKEASGNFSQIMHIIKNKPDHFQVISGDDALTLPMVYLGGSGVISVIANSHPADYSTMVRAALNGEHELANSIHYKLIDIIEALFEEGSPAGVKAALNHFGICGPQVRLPLVSASAGLRKKIGNLIG